jgi:hypothetical protein
MQERKLGKSSLTVFELRLRCANAMEGADVERRMGELEDAIAETAKSNVVPLRKRA